MPDAAVIVAGGRGRRLGGVDKPALLIDGVSLLDRALAAVAGIAADRIVVVGGHRDLGPFLLQAIEDPPGSGPAAAVVAGLSRLGPMPDGATVALLAADLPAITAATVARLTVALGAGTGAVLVDIAGRRQYLEGVFRVGGLAAAVAGRNWAGQRLAVLLDPLVSAEVPTSGFEDADIDTPDDLDRWRAGAP